MADDIQNDWGAQAVDIEQLLRLYQNPVLSGCAPSDGSGALEIDVASGEVVVAGTQHSVSSSTVTLSSGGSDPRKDIVYIDSTGSAATAQGGAQTAKPSGQTRRDTYKPRPPDLSGTDACVIAEVWVAAGASDTAAADISDRRVFGDVVANQLDFGNRTADPTLTDGLMWFRSDNDVLKWSPDGTNTQLIGWTT